MSLCLVGGASFGAAQETALKAPKQTIGATAVIMEVSSGARFKARVDTGAKSCSLHIDEIRFQDASDKMRENIGKVAQFQVRDSSGKAHWITEKIFCTVQVKTSAKKERRYKVWLTLRYGEVEKRVKVTLNDRSQMEFPLLMGRNFLCNDFVVDVSLGQSRTGG